MTAAIVEFSIPPRVVWTENKNFAALCGLKTTTD